MVNSLKLKDKIKLYTGTQEESNRDYSTSGFVIAVARWTRIPIGMERQLSAYL